MCAIGRALMNDPALVLFDEPTSALDTKLGEQVMELIQNEMKSRDIAAIVVTHDERITHFCDRSVHIVDGRLDGGSPVLEVVRRVVVNAPYHSAVDQAPGVDQDIRPEDRALGSPGSIKAAENAGGSHWDDPDKR